jgi:hypothetical protein
VIKSTKDNKFVFGAMGDLHAASKYTRWEVRKDLMVRAANEGASCIFDTGNWIDGEASFNRYDVEAVGSTTKFRFSRVITPRLGYQPTP